MEVCLDSVQQRIQNLRTGGFFALLALDHGLTYGGTNSVDPEKISSLLHTCQGKIGGVVLTFGLAKHLKTDDDLPPVIIQCFGGPLEAEKVQIASVEQALRLKAVAVSVQLSLDAQRPPRSSHTREIGRFVAAADQHDLPVLFMVTVQDPSNLNSVGKAIRVSQELGADIIKVRVVLREEAPLIEVERLAYVVNQAPPVLLAGGPTGSDLMAEAQAAACRLAFSGYCVGRNIFQAREPLSVVSDLNRIWDNLSHSTIRREQ